MDKYKKIDVKILAKGSLMILLAIFVLMFVISTMDMTLLEYNYDNYFQFAHGNYLMEHGFPRTEPLRMHEGFDFMIPQWLWSYTITIIRNLFGNIGVLVFALLLLTSIFGVTLAILRKFFKGNSKVYLFSILTLTWFVVCYSYIRPYLVTILCLLLVFYFCESYVQSKKKQWLIGIPLISVLMVNMHNSLWIGLFLVLACFIGEWCIQKLRKQESFSIYPIFVVTGLSFLAGFINPYGLDYMLYILPSMKAIEPLSNFIGELRKLYDVSPLVFGIIFTEICIPFLIMVIKKIHIPIRYLFLMCGFGFMYFMNIRNGIFFITLGQMPIYYLLSLKEGSTVVKRMSLCLLGLMLVSTWFVCLTTGLKDSPDKGAFKAVDRFMEIAPPETVDSVFTNFNIGSYATYKGYPVYIDTCAEIYGQAVNHTKDVANEFVVGLAMQDQDRANYFFDRYDFQYCLSDAEWLAALIEGTGKYECIFKEIDADGKGGGWIYERK